MGVRQAAAMEAMDSYGNSQLPRLLRPALEFHSHGGRFGGTCLGCPACCPVMRHKTGFLLAMLHHHGRKAAWGCGKPQPRRPFTVMENHSYQGSLDPLWNSTAIVGVHSYGIPEQIKTGSGVDCTHRFPARRRIQSCHGTYALFA
jgi:hypothetical protein